MSDIHEADRLSYIADSQGRIREKLLGLIDTDPVQNIRKAHALVLV